MPARTSPRTADGPESAPESDRYRWIVLSNTTLGVFMASLDSSIVLISLPAIFRGIHLDPLQPGNVGYLLWMLMGYLVVTAVLVVTFGRLGDIFGRVRMYNAGFAVFSGASLALSLCPYTGSSGALWLIAWRVVQGIGGALLTANSAAILTDAFPAAQRGFAIGVSVIAGMAGAFIGLVAGGLLADVDWRAVFWINVPIGVFGTVWAYLKLRELGTKKAARIDWWGNATFGVGLVLILIGLTYGLIPHGGHTMGWAGPWVLFELIAGAALLVVFAFVERRVTDPMFDLDLFRIRAFTMGNLASFLSSIGRGGLQFILIIWLQGIWLPLHGYNYVDTPLWAGIYLLPLTFGFLASGPVSGWLSDRFGARMFATGGLLLVAVTFVALIVLPVNFTYWQFAVILALNGIGSGLFSAPNVTAIMNSVPAHERGAASGVRGTVFNSGTSLSIGVFFSLMIVGLAHTLPTTMSSGLMRQGVPGPVAHQVAGLPPVGSLFASFLGYNPIGSLLGPSGVLDRLPAANQATLTGKSFFPHLMAQPFHHGLVIVFLVAAVMMVVGAVASYLAGGKYIHDDSLGEALGREV